MINLNEMFNYIHAWSEPDQPALIRVGLARLGSLACAAIEMGDLAYHCRLMGSQLYQGAKIQLSKAFIILMLGPEALPKNKHPDTPNVPFMKRHLLIVCKLIAGLVFTFFVGIVLSPETNFRIHLKLGLVVNIVGLIKLRDMKCQSEADSDVQEVQQDRAARLAKFYRKWKAHRKVVRETNGIDRNMVDILTPEAVKKSRA